MEGEHGMGTFPGSAQIRQGSGVAVRHLTEALGIEYGQTGTDILCIAANLSF